MTPLTPTHSTQRMLVPSRAQPSPPTCMLTTPPLIEAKASLSKQQLATDVVARQSFESYSPDANVKLCRCLVFLINRCTSLPGYLPNEEL